MSREIGKEATIASKGLLSGDQLFEPATGRLALLNRLDSEAYLSYVFALRPNEPVIRQLLQNVRRPSGRAGNRKQRREQVDGKPQ